MLKYFLSLGVSVNKIMFLSLQNVQQSGLQTFLCSQIFYIFVLLYPVTLWYNDSTYVPGIYNDGGVIPKERNSSFCFFVTSPMTFPT